MGIFKFVRSAITGVGIGTRDLGLEQQLNLVPASIYGPRHNVRKQLAISAPAFAKVGQAVVPVSILGNSGIALQGTLELRPLASDNGDK